MIQGYIIKIPNERLELFVGHTNSNMPFGEPVPSFSHGKGSPLIVFISTADNEITYLASGRPGMRAGTGLRRLNLDEIHEVPVILRFTEILQLVPANVRRHIATAFESGGILPPASFIAVVNAVHSIAPNISHLLTRFGTERVESIRRLSSQSVAPLASQKEAISTALFLAEIERKPLLEWTPPQTEQPLSFLDGLPQARLREDQMLIHDLHQFPGLNEIQESITGAVQFEGQGVKLDIILANRLPLEEQTGADLIYYNETLQSFVMVQYKAMEDDGDENGQSFRLPNAKLSAEIARMDTLMTQLESLPRPSHRDGYRLNENPFFIKLCPRIVFDPDNVALTPGMYFSRDHWRFLETDADLVGPRGGRKILYKNQQRHLDNTQFATLVQNAWVGTTPAQSTELAQILRSAIESGKAVVIAIKSKKEVLNSDEF